MTVQWLERRDGHRTAHNFSPQFLLVQNVLAFSLIRITTSIVHNGILIEWWESPYRMHLKTWPPSRELDMPDLPPICSTILLASLWRTNSICMWLTGATTAFSCSDREKQLQRRRLEMDRVEQLHCITPLQSFSMQMDICSSLMKAIIVSLDQVPMVFDVWWVVRGSAVQRPRSWISHRRWVSLATEISTC